MASFKPNTTDTTATPIQAIFSNKALLGPGQKTLMFHTDAHGNAYDKSRAAAERIEAELKRGNVPSELIRTQTLRAERAAINTANVNPTFFQMLRDYETRPHSIVTDSQRETGSYLMKEIASVRFLEMTMEWINERLDYYKDVKKYEPGTIKKRIEFLSNVHDHTQMKAFKEKRPSICNQLPVNYSKRHDHVTLRQRRSKIGIRPLTVEREAAIRAVFTGEKEISTKSIRVLRDPKLEVLFTLISNTGMRLSEAYMVRVEDIDFDQYIVHIGGTKGRDDEIKHRQTTILKRVRESLRNYIDAFELKGEDFLFRDGWWIGDCDAEDKTERKKARKATSSYLSGVFRSLYVAAGVTGITEHDLRHEATIRYIELRNGKSEPYFDRERMMKMMGWSTYAMADLYLSTWRPEIGKGFVPDDL